MTTRQAIKVSSDFRFTGSMEFLPAVRTVGHRVWTRDQPQARGAHSHSDAWEIHYLASGRLEWWIDDALCSLQAGDCFIAAPGQVHSGIDRVVHRSRVMWVCLPLIGRGALPWLNPRERQTLLEQFEHLKSLRFQAGKDLGVAFEQLCTAIEERQIIVARAAIHQVLAQTLVAHDRAVAQGHQRDEQDEVVNACMHKLAEDLTEVATIEELAKDLGCSRATLYRRFHSATGMSPIGYWQRMRVQQAKHLLEQGHTAASVAEQLGFAHAQHFGRSFKQHTGSSPAAWQRNVSN